jgi:hypothetical protein
MAKCELIVRSGVFHGVTSSVASSYPAQRRSGILVDPACPDERSVGGLCTSLLLPAARVDLVNVVSSIDVDEYGTVHVGPSSFCNFPLREGPAPLQCLAGRDLLRVCVRSLPHNAGMAVRPANDNRTSWSSRPFTAQKLLQVIAAFLIGLFAAVMLGGPFRNAAPERPQVDALAPDLSVPK